MASKPKSPYYFDNKEATKAELFFRDFLVHVKGEWAGTPLELLPWQKKLVRNMFGWKRREDGTRKYRQVYIEVPRKNGKSTMCAGIALYMLFADGEEGAEVYSAAADREQAHIVFDMARQMALRDDYLSERCAVYQKSISVASTGSRYKSLSADADTKLGYNPSCVIFDEIAVQKHRKLYDALWTGRHSRRQPLMVMITTAGVADQTSIGWDRHDYACKVRDGIIKDDSFMPVIYEAAQDADWTDEKVWKASNPSWGISVKPEGIREECEAAKASPAAQNSFRRFYMNQWVAQETRWIDMAVWDSCDEMVDRDELKGYAAFAGLDLSTTDDLTAFVLLFPPEEDDQLWEVIPYFWVPEDTIQKRVEKDRVPYDQWVREGWIEVTPGGAVDHSYIRRRINEIAEDYDVQQIAIDPYNAHQITTQLFNEDGFDVVSFRQGTLSFNPPMRDMMAKLLNKELRHGGHPILRWNADNMVARRDVNDNLAPDKQGRTWKIDGVVALLMALGLTIEAEVETNVYEDRLEAGEELITLV